jgi:hypothetical protein
LSRELANACAFVGQKLNETFCSKNLQGLPQRCPRHAKPLTEAPLWDTLAGLQMALDDEVPKAGHDLTVKVLSFRRIRRTRGRGAFRMQTAVHGNPYYEPLSL